MLDVVLVGELCLDVIVTGIPRKLTKKLLTFVDLLEIRAGGIAFNTAAGLTALGLRCGIIGKVGKDKLGQFLLNEIKRHNIDVSRTIFSEEINTHASVDITFKDFSKGFFATPEYPLLSFEEIDLEYLTRAKVLFLAGWLREFKLWRYGERLVRKAKDENLIVVMDPARPYVSGWKTSLKKMLKFIDIMLLDETEAMIITGEKDPVKAAKYLLKGGVRYVGIKLGKQGCLIAVPKQFIKLPAYKVRIVDTVGAGDAWNAGFIYAFQRGMSISQIAKFANAVAALTISRIKTKEGYPTLRDVQQFLTQYNFLT